MELLRIQNLWWLLILATPVWSIGLLDVLDSYPELSILWSYLNGTATKNNLLSKANNFTFLAPSNDAIQKLIYTSYNQTLSTDTFQALTQYSLLQGGFPTLSFSDTPQFIPSNLKNATYANVTGGQAVELVKNSDGKSQVVTGNKNISTISTSDIVCTGGIVHIIDDVMSIPISAVDEIPAAHLDYFVQILNNGGFLNAANSYVDAVLGIPDVTFFIPNSAQALNTGNLLKQNTSSDAFRTLFEYHVVTGFVGYSPLLGDGMQLKTAQGGNLTIRMQGGDMYVNAAKVTTSDYIIANGVVHVIDDLLNPNNTAGPPPPTSMTSQPSQTATSTPTAAATPAAKHFSSSSGLSTGAKAGIGVGAAIGGILLLICLILLFRSKRVQRDSPSFLHVGQPMSDVPTTIGTYRYRGNDPTGMQGMKDSEYSEPTSAVTPPAQQSPLVPERSPNHRFVDPSRQ
ncbi:MAG: hypothetical protein Q9227_003649 [Pyrenula ochraceoflavens]